MAQHEGIGAACREMPYGIQQPAVSSQLIRLEEDLGLRLFTRRPFALTEAARELFEFVAPFFSRLPEMEARLRGEVARELRLTGLSEALRDHAPELLRGPARAHVRPSYQTAASGPARGGRTHPRRQG